MLENRGGHAGLLSLSLKLQQSLFEPFGHFSFIDFLSHRYIVAAMLQG